MCYLTNLSFMLYFIFWIVEDPVQRLMRARANEEHSKKLDSTSADATDVQVRELPPFTKTQMAKIAGVFFVLYLFSNYLTNKAFEETSVSSVSILAATCGFFTLIFGWIMRVEVLSIMRIVAVIISVGGVLLLGIPELLDSSSESSVGNICALVGAFFYGLYSIFLKRVAIDESRISMPILFGFSGLYTLLFAWPVFFLLHWKEVESFSLPPNSQVSIYIAINVFLGGFLPNYLWNVAFVCTSPLVVAIGISFTIPLTLVTAYYRGDPIDIFRIGSGLLVVIGFVIVNLSNIYPQLDLAAERFLVRCRLMRPEHVKSTEERAAIQRSILLEAHRV